MLGMPGAAPQRTHLGLAEVGEPVGLLQAELLPARKPRRRQMGRSSDGARVACARGARAARSTHINLMACVGRREKGRAGARAAVGTAVSESIAFATTEA